MQIDTQKTVEKTLAQYRWDDLRNWQKSGPVDDGVFRRQMYQSANVTVFQQKWSDGQGVVVETPDYTMYVGMGYHLNVFDGRSTTKYYSLDVATTKGEKKVYQSLMDEAGYKNICGDRQHLFYFKEKTPGQYFSLEVDEAARYISSCWMRIPRRLGKSKRLIKELE